MTRPRDAQLPLLLTMSEGLSRGPDEMVPVSPNDSMHPPSCGLAIRDAVEEIKWLRAEVERLRAERDTLLLDARDFVRWFNRHYPDPTSNPDHPWCAINSRLNAHADVLATFDSGVDIKEEEEEGR
jgi:hypothetical protein